MHRHIRNPITRLLAFAALVLTLLALAPGLAGAGTTAQNERVNSGWYTGLEYADLPPGKPAVQNERFNSGWYTGLEYADLPSAQAAADDDGFPWQNGSVALGAALAALLVMSAVARRGTLATR